MYIKHPMFTTDPDVIEQVWINHLLNACYEVNDNEQIWNNFYM